MKIVFVGRNKPENIDKLTESLGYLGQEVTLYSGNIFTLVFIPFRLRVGDIYFYRKKDFPSFVMKFLQKLLNKAVVPLEIMPKETYAFEKKCYREYALYYLGSLDNLSKQIESRERKRKGDGFCKRAICRRG